MLKHKSKMTNLSKDLIDFIDNSECWLDFNETDWVKSDDLRSDFCDHLVDLINKGCNYILLLYYPKDSSCDSNETFVGTKKEIEHRLEQAYSELEFEDEVEHTVYDILNDKICQLNSVKTWEWT